MVSWRPAGDLAAHRVADADVSFDGEGDGQPDGSVAARVAERHDVAAVARVPPRHLTAARTPARDDNGSAGHGSRVKCVNKFEWVTGQYS